MRPMQIAIQKAEGLAPGDAETLAELVRTWDGKRARNLLRESYYRMHRRPRELGISVPPHLRRLEQAMGWPAKAVDSLAARSQFDGFVAPDDVVSARLQSICAESALKRKYRRLLKSELMHSCSFATVTRGEDGRPKVCAYPATAAAAVWSQPEDRIRAGMVVVDTERQRAGMEPRAVAVDMFTDTDVIRLRRSGRGRWRAEYLPHSMGRCLMVPLAYDADLERPFGRSRISRAVMDLTDDAMRASVRSEVSAEFFTAPQKYLLGADGEALGDMTKWDAYIGNIFAVGKDADGDVPKYGQLPQGSMQPHIDYMRSLAARFSGETNVPLSELGVVSDNPSSAEAIYAAKEPLVIEAMNLNADNGEALRNIALMCLAVEDGCGYPEAMVRYGGVQARFRNPAMPSPVTQADSVVKGVAAFPWLADTDVALEEYGFTDEQIARMRPARDRFNARAMVAGAVGGTGLKVASNPDPDIGQ